MPTIKLQGQPIEYRIRESKRAKRINMRIDTQKGLELVYPIGITSPKPETVLKQNQHWVLSTLNKVQRRAETLFQRQYQKGEIFRYLGQDKTLHIIEKQHGKRMTVSLSETALEVSIPSTVKQTVDTLKDAIEKFYRKQAKSYLPERTRQIADELGFDYERVTIKNQKTRWGSCSNKKNLNLNLRLMMAPPDAIDYIIIHELCHLVHLNHSKAFWHLVGQHCPQYTYWRRWFKQNSQFLVL